MPDFSLSLNHNDILWDQYVESSEQCTIFLTHKYIESLKIPNKKYILKNGNQPVCGCVVLESDNGMCLKSPFCYTPYQGFFFIYNDFSSKDYHKRVERQHQITKHMIDKLIDNYGALSQTHFNLEDYRPFLWHNYHTPENGIFKLDLFYTSILDLQSFQTIDEFLDSIRAVRRRDYKKIKESKISISLSPDIDIFFNLYSKTFLRQRIEVTTPQKEIIKSIITFALKNNYGKMMTAWINDVPVSVIFFLLDRKRSYYLFGANDPDYRNTQASTFLFVEFVWHCKKEGVKELDFIGVNSPNRGDFKLSFGGKLIPYFATHYKV
ncbi:MAG: GNAT family N-acetyltransferase [Candidatus Xenobiia bacterium LiM19]